MIHLYVTSKLIEYGRITVYLADSAIGVVSSPLSIKCSAADPVLYEWAEKAHIGFQVSLDIPIAGGEA